MLEAIRLMREVLRHLFGPNNNSALLWVTEAAVLKYRLNSRAPDGNKVRSSGRDS